MKWDADTYTQEFSFVADYGRDVLGLLRASGCSTWVAATAC